MGTQARLMLYFLKFGSCTYESKPHHEPQPTYYLTTERRLKEKDIHNVIRLHLIISSNYNNVSNALQSPSVYMTTHSPHSSCLCRPHLEPPFLNPLPPSVFLLPLPELLPNRVLLLSRIHSTACQLRHVFTTALISCFTLFFSKTGMCISQADEASVCGSDLGLLWRSSASGAYEELDDSIVFQSSIKGRSGKLGASPDELNESTRDDGW